MSEFKQKLKYLLNDKEINNDITFNKSLLKIYKKIKRENNTKSINKKINKNNIIFENFLKNNINKYSLDKIKRSKSTNSLANVMRSFSINDIHINKNIKNYNLYYIKNTNNKYNINNYYNTERVNSNLNNKMNYVNSLFKNYKINTNNYKRNNNILNLNNLNNILYNNENFMPYNKITIYNENQTMNFFRKTNKTNYDDKQKRFLINNIQMNKNKINDTFMRKLSNITYKN